jgi:putative DNA-invertase from lambdoid prophage Rac
VADRCALWARVSKDEQESGNQLGELRAEAVRRGLDVAAEYVLDGASAWKGEHRALLRQALDDARAGGYDVLLVWALDRLSREGIEATLRAMRQFADRGVPVWSLRESWTETSDPHVRELIAAIMAWVARMESERRSERVRAGLARRRAAGLPVGRQPGAKDRKPRRRSGYVAAWEDGGKRRGRVLPAEARMAG